MNSTHKETFNDTFYTLFFIMEGLIAVPTIFGNILLIYCINHFKNLHAYCYVLIANLAVSDLLTGLVFIPIDMLSAWVPFMRENKFTCLMRNAVLMEFVGASVFILLAISLERYAATAYPLWHYKLSRKWLVVGVVGPWILSTLVAFPPILGWNTWNPKRKCTYMWMDAFTKGYKLFWISTFTGAIVISAIFYVKVVIISFNMLNAAKGNASSNNGHVISRRLTKPVEKTKVLILVLGMFMSCWTPFCIISVIAVFLPNGQKEIDDAYVYSGLLAFLNSSLNWIIYGVKNRKIRHAFRLTLCSKKKLYGKSSELWSSISSVRQVSN